MNWIDYTAIALLGYAAMKGFTRGFIIELCSLAGLILGIWAGTHLNTRVAERIGLDPQQELISFLVTFVGVIVLVHLLGRALTKAIDIAMLTVPNKLAGVLFGVVRQAFALSVLLNCTYASDATSTFPSKKAREGSLLYAPLKAFAPIILPSLQETKWVREMVEEAKEGVGKVLE